MPPRTRLDEPISYIGTITVYGGTGTRIVRNRFLCDDVVGERESENPLYIDKITRTGGQINGNRGTSWIWKDFAATAYGGWTPYVVPATGGIPVTQILSMGPLTPRVNLPLFVLELKDIPRMLKHAGDILHGLVKNPFGELSAEGIASKTLAYQFGWKPLIEDLMKLTNFAEYVAKRQRELERAQSRKGLRRKVTITDEESSWSGTVIAESAGVWFEPPTHDKYRKHSWATTRWKIREDADTRYKQPPTWTDAFRSALGLNRGMIPVTIWKALPWTWFIDWFFNLSHHLQASYNLLYYKPVSLCFMETRETLSSCPEVVKHYDDGTVTLSAFSCTRVIKTRRVVYDPQPTLSIKLPFLDSFKLSVLGSLTVLKVKRAI